jgi:hypothetical protein
MKSRNKDLIKTFSDTCLSMLENNLKLLDEPGAILNHQRKFLASFKMSIDNQELIWDVTPVIDIIRFEGKDLLVKMLRSIHHDYSVMNVQEMATALNRHEQSISIYSEEVPNQLYIIKALADSIEGINPVTQ